MPTLPAVCDACQHGHHRDCDGLVYDPRTGTVTVCPCDAKECA